MPNHVINEIIIPNTNWLKRRQILKKVLNEKREIDFEILLPTPLNSWKHNTGKEHEESFPETDLNWCRKNWGTKWNAYGQEEDEYKYINKKKKKLVLIFKTAWNPPRGWILALFNYFKITFTHNWMSEGSDDAFIEEYNYEKFNTFDEDPWEKRNADESLLRHLHYLLWGCETFEEEPDDSGEEAKE